MKAVRGIVGNESGARDSGYAPLVCAEPKIAVAVFTELVRLVFAQAVRHAVIQKP